MFKFNQKNFYRGFTLLEALVAISILMVAVVAPITIAQKGLSSAIYSKNQMIASYLAQDAIEYIKNKRDEQTINNSEHLWNNLFSTGGFFSNCMINDPPVPGELGCRIDTINDIVSSYGVVGDPLLKNANNFYQYSDNTNGVTNFKRKIEILLKDISTGGTPVYDEALVTVTVSWGEDPLGEKLVVKTLIYQY